MIRVAILGAGGLGKGMAQFIPHRPDFQLVAMADSQGYCFDDNGLDIETVLTLKTVAQYPELGVPSSNAILELLQSHSQMIDGIFMALPNLPVEFYAETIKMITEKTTFKGVFVDALKRTKAVEQLLPLDKMLRANKLLYITGAGATPGFLTTVAAVAAQSFVEVLSVDIHFGVGISSWENYKATVREDLLHLEGFDAERVSAMSDEEVKAELDSRNGLIELVNMEHADDIILELAGLCPRESVTVGGLVDTRNAKKPVSTTVTITGKTVAGAIGSHRFTVSDETTMVDNVCGPALGFLLRGTLLRQEGRFGLMTSAELMPRFGTQVFKSAKRDAVKEKAALV
jgi:hypothetical protein